MIIPKEKSAFTGTMITAGSVIGAGIFSLPVVSSGMWFGWSMLILLVVWYLNYLISLVLLEVNCHFEPGASFDTFVTSILGKTWNLLAGLGLAFLLYILLYAYYTAFRSMATHVLGSDHPLLGIFIGLVLAAVVWISTSFVGRISTVLVVGMAISYIVSMFGLSFYVEATKLMNTMAVDASYASYTWASLPYFLTSFGFASMVPSLYKYYGRAPLKIRDGLRYGSIVALVVYAVFILVCFGTVSRVDFLPINQAGGNMGDLVGALSQGRNGSTINFAMSIFSNFAIVSSFLGVGLGLFDYIADKFGLSDSKTGRLSTALLTFVPSAIASFFYPYGFIEAIGFAGIALAFSFILVPVLMLWKLRSEGKYADYRLWGGNGLLIGIMALTVVIVTCKILGILEMLPVYG